MTIKLENIERGEDAVRYLYRIAVKMRSKNIGLHKEKVIQLVDNDAGILNDILSENLIIYLNWEGDYYEQ